MRKCTFWHVHPTKIQISLRIRAIWLVFIVHMKKHCIIGYPKCTQWRFWSDCMNVQSDLNLCWAHIWRYIFWCWSSNISDLPCRSTHSPSLIHVVLDWRNRISQRHIRQKVGSYINREHSDKPAYQAQHHKYSEKTDFENEQIKYGSWLFMNSFFYWCQEMNSSFCDKYNTANKT